MEKKGSDDANLFWNMNPKTVKYNTVYSCTKSVVLTENQVSMLFQDFIKSGQITLLLDCNFPVVYYLIPVLKYKKSNCQSTEYHHYSEDRW
jgi:hypothetical protein